MDHVTQLPTEGPGFLSGLLWATAVLTLCTFAVGALYQGAENPTKIVATQR